MAHSDKVKVFYDGYYFSQETYGGISRMWENIICGLLDRSDYECVLFSEQSGNKALKSIVDRGAGSGRFRLIRQIKLKPGRIFNALRTRGLLLDAVMASNMIGKDCIFHSTLNTMPFFGGRRRIVITVHDLNTQLFPEIFSSAPGYKHTLIADEASIRRSDRLIAVSETTKSDILKLYPGVPAGKISVIYHGLSPSFLGQDISSGRKRGDYLLFVGGRNRYKNYWTLLKAFADLKKRAGVGLRLITVGPDTGPEDKKIEEDIISSNGLKGSVIDKGFVSDSELAELYKGAAAMVFPSLYEGFGIPLIESMACGCPVIASDIPVFRELGRRYVRYFDPHSETELSRIMGEVLSCEPDHGLIKEACAYANTFTWEASVNKTMAVYKNLKEE